MSERPQIVQLMLPWFDPAGDLCYSNMVLTASPKVDRRIAFRMMRKWYKEHIGITICKTTMQRVWKYRHVTRAMSMDDMHQKLHDMARRSREEIEDHTDSGTQEEAAGETGR